MRQASVLSIMLVMRKRCELTVDVIMVSSSIGRSPYVARTRSPSVTARQLTTDSPNRAERPEMTLSSGERSLPLRCWLQLGWTSQKANMSSTTPLSGITVLKFHVYGGDSGSRAGCRPKNVIMFFCYLQARAKRSHAGIVGISGPTMGFSPRRGDTLTRQTLNLARGSALRSPVPYLTFIGEKCGNAAPKTAKTIQLLLSLQNTINEYMCV